MTNSEPARPLRSGFSFAVGEHRRRLRVELAATLVGSLCAPNPCAEPPVALKKTRATSPGPWSLLSGRGFSRRRAASAVNLFAAAREV